MSLDLPSTPLFKDSQGGNIIPQVRSLRAVVGRMRSVCRPVLTSSIVVVLRVVWL